VSHQERRAVVTFFWIAVIAILIVLNIVIYF